MGQYYKEQRMDRHLNSQAGDDQSERILSFTDPLSIPSPSSADLPVLANEYKQKLLCSICSAYMCTCL